jgi:hypothetical protein
VQHGDDQGSIENLAALLDHRHKEGGPAKERALVRNLLQRTQRTMEPTARRCVSRAVCHRARPTTAMEKTDAWRYGIPDRALD